MPFTRRQAIAGGGGLLWLAASPAHAQAYPARPIKLIVPYPAGGTTDLLGRLVADQLKSGLGATVVVENKPGAGTTLGAEQVSRSEPDGYTLLMATSTTLAINKTLYKKLPYDPVKDFTPIALVAGVPFALIVNPTLPVTTLAEFIAYAKSRPGPAYRPAPPRRPPPPRAPGAPPPPPPPHPPTRPPPGAAPPPASRSGMCPIAAAYRRCSTSSPGTFPSWSSICSRRCRRFATASCGCSASPRRSGSPPRPRFRRWRKRACPASNSSPGRAWS